MIRILALMLLTVGCSAPHIWTTQRFGPVAVDGELALSTAGGGVSSSTEGLGLDDDDSSWSPRVDLDLAAMHINLGRFGSEHSGTGVAESTLNFGGSMITVGDTVRSQLDLEMTTIAFTFDLVPSSLLDIGIGFGGGTLAYDARIESTTTAMVVESDESVPVGFLAARIASELGDFRLSLDLAGLEISINDDDLKYLDADAAVAWKFFDPGGPGFGELVVGYRVIQTEIEIDESGGRVEADLDFSGAYVGLSIGL